MSNGIRLAELTNGNELQRTDKLYATRGSGAGADRQVYIPLYTDSAFNTALGINVLPNAGSSYSNTAFGHSILVENLGGIGNHAFGSEIFKENVSGNSNIGIGYNLGNTLETGHANILIGSVLDVPAVDTSAYLNIGGTITGTTSYGTPTLNSVGNFSVATDKLTVNATTGNTGVAGTLGVTGAITGGGYSGGAISGTSGAFSSTLGCTGNFAVATNKLTVNAVTGNALIAGTLGVTGAITGGGYSGGAISGTSGAFSTTLGCTGNFAVNTNKFTVSAVSGATSVASNLTVAGELHCGIKGFFSGGLSVNNTTGPGGIYVGVPDNTNAMLLMDTNGFEKVQLRDDTVIFTGVYASTTATAANVNVDATGQLRRSTSSRRFKENERPLEMDTTKIDNVESCTFNMKDSGQLGHGPISEDIALVEPNFATYDLEGKPEAIHTNNLLYALIVEHQKLKKTVTALEERLAKLEAK